MTINMTFGSYEEVVAFAKKLAGETAEQIKTPATSKKTKEVAPVENEAPAEAETPAEDMKEVKPTTYTLEDVRACLGTLQKAGKKDQVRELIKSFGADKLPEIDPKNYPELMAKAGELNAQ